MNRKTTLSGVEHEVVLPAAHRGTIPASNSTLVNTLRLVGNNEIFVSTTSDSDKNVVSFVIAEIEFKTFTSFQRLVVRVICSASAANAVGIAVSTRDNLVCHVAVATTASVCGITVSCAGRPCDLRGIAVSMWGIVISAGLIFMAVAVICRSVSGVA